MTALLTKLGDMDANVANGSTANQNCSILSEGSLPSKTLLSREFKMAPRSDRL